jgi:hypothetical protein
MRRILVPVLLSLAACGDVGEAGNDTAAHAPSAAATVPPPTTPVLNVAEVPGNEAAWMEPREVPDPRPSAPYANLLDAPVVETPRAK